MCRVIREADAGEAELVVRGGALDRERWCQSDCCVKPKRNSFTILGVMV